MDAILPLALAAMMFPLSFAVRRLGHRRWGFMLPLALAVLFVAFIPFDVESVYVYTLFAILGLGLSWRWRATAVGRAG